jgi:nitrite reductase/ring-hydroxylating ferredoxin subunit
LAEQSNVSTLPEEGYVRQLCQRIADSLEDHVLPVEVFNDEHLFKEEMRKVFTKAWVFLGHDSEIPNSADFMLRKVGLDQVIVTRSADGSINVLLNHCRHRGSEVCHEDRGNSSHFKCPYHGWIFKNNGDFVGAPNMNEAYGGRLDPKEWGLLRAPKVDTIHGLIFCTLDPNAPSLRDYLGSAAEMMDGIFGLHPDGMKVLGVPERAIIRSDWKIGAENFAGDAYHVGTAHFSVSASGLIPSDIRETGPNALTYVHDGGHSFVGHHLSRWFGPPFVFWGYPPEMVDQFDFSGLSEDMVAAVRDRPPTIGTIFPNMSFVRFPSPPGGAAMPIPATRISMWQPLAPGLMELWSWQLGWRFASDAFNEASYLAGQLSFGTGGMVEQDDTAVWEGIERVGRSPWARNAKMALHYAQTPVPPDPDWKGPGRLFPTVFGETAQREFWAHWLSLMQADERTAAAAAGVSNHD